MPVPFWLKQDQTTDSPLTSSLTSDDLSPGDVMLHCSTLVEAVVVANVTVFLGDLFVTGGVIIRVHYPILNMKKPPTANTTMIKVMVLHGMLHSSPKQHKP